MKLFGINIIGKKGVNTLKICPKCLKESLKQTKHSWAFTEYFVCQNEDCNYEGAFHLEVDLEEEGENFADMEYLREEFSDDIETDTEIEYNKQNLKSDIDLNESKTFKKQEDLGKTILKKKNNV